VGVGVVTTADEQLVKIIVRKTIKAFLVTSLLM
jgi:hypothetical protein